MSVRNDRQSLYPVLMIGVGAALILSSIAWLAYTTRVTAARTLSISQAAPTLRAPYSDVQRVSLSDAKATYDLGMATFVDVRGEPYFSQGHIPGALSITEAELNNRLSELDAKKWIITYCT